MIISRTPFRISLFGGGSDFPRYYNYNVGKVIGFTFNRYNYILFNPKFQKNEFKYNYKIYSRSTSRFDRIFKQNYRNKNK